MSSSNNTTLLAAATAVIGAVAGFGLSTILHHNHKRKKKENTTSYNEKERHDRENVSSIAAAAATTATAKTTPHAVRLGLTTTSSTIRLSRNRLDLLLSEIIDRATHCGKDKSDLVASVLSYADSRGIPSHGCNRCDTYINEIVAGLVNAKADPIVESISGSCAVINGMNGLGAVTSNLAMKTAIQLAKQHGISIVTCHASNHYGAAGYWAQMALDVGMIGMSFTNTSPIAVPTGGMSRAVGTNPFCFFAPASEDDSFQLDMATTVVPIGKVEVMDRINKAVPTGWGVDGNGKDCTTASIICKEGGLYPLGGQEETAGYKGYGLGMFVEILCSVLSGASVVGPDVQSWNVHRKGPLDYSHCFLVIDPNRFVVDGGGGGGSSSSKKNSSSFDERLNQYLKRMRSLPGGNVKVAGDPEKEFENDSKKKNGGGGGGILLHESVATTLKALAIRYKVEENSNVIPPEFDRLDISKSKASLYE